MAHDRLERKLEEARRIAELRSGARGKDARAVLIKVEQEVAESNALLAEDVAALAPGVVAEETQLAVDMLADAENALEMVGSPLRWLPN